MDALRESEERFRSTFEQAAVGIAHVAPDGAFLRVNQKLCDIVGYPRGELLRRTFQDITFPDDLDADLAYVRQMLAGVIPTYTMEKRYIRKDGRVVWINLTVALVRRHDGSPKYFISVIQDIDARKRVELAHRRIVADTAGVGEVFFQGLVRGLAEALGARVALVGELTSEEPLQVRTIAIWRDGAAQPNLAYPLAGTPCEGVMTGAMCFHRRGAAAAFPDDPMLAAMGIESYLGTPLFGADHRPVGLIVVLHDAALDDRLRPEEILRFFAGRAEAELERARAEVALQRAAERLETLRAIDRAILMAESPQEIAQAALARVRPLVDAVAAAIVTLREDRLEAEIMAVDRQTGVAGLGDRMPLGAFAPPVLEILRAGRPYVVEDVGRLQATTPFLEAAAATGLRALLGVPLRFQGALVGLMVFRRDTPGPFAPEQVDIAVEVADHLAIAMEHSRLYREVQAASRAKDQFLAVLSHELRSPLTPILGWVRLLRDGALDDDKRRRALEVIERNALAQTQLVNDLLDVTAIVSGKLRLEMRPVDLAEAVRAAVDGVRLAAAAKGVALKVVADGPDVFVAGDPARLQQIFANLLSNAVKFTPAGGAVTVEIAAGPAVVVVRVADTGEGIAASFLPFVFERFRQADSSSTRAHEGLGIGLAVARELVELHGGHIRGESDGPGAGATFTVELPVRDAPARERLAVVSVSQEALAGVRILVVEDVRDTRELLAELLVASGAEVRAVDSTAAALEAVVAWRPDLLLSDIGMPGEDGYALIRRLRALSPGEGGGLAAVALSGYARDDDRRRALEAGFQAHLSKPITREGLLGAVVPLVRRGEAGGRRPRA